MPYNEATANGAKGVLMNPHQRVYLDMINGLKKIEFISPKIIHLIFDNRYNMSDVLMRFSEYYESPKYRGKNFTRKELLNWYKKIYKKDYHSAWAGFNIPSYALKAEMFDKDSTKSEEVFINFFKNIKGNFYIIGSNEKDTDVKKHELCHAMFYLNPSYKKEVIKQIKKHDVHALKMFLKFTGYCDDVLLDEINAYITSGEWDLLDDNVEIADKYSKMYRSLHVKLDLLFEKYQRLINK